MKYVVILFSLIVLSNIHSIEGGWGGSRTNITRPVSNNGRNVHIKYAGATAQNANNVASNTKLEAVQRRGLGFSAWGIIGIVIGGILTIMGIYYTSVFYPILCKKERCYDKMSAISNV